MEARLDAPIARDTPGGIELLVGMTVTVPDGDAINPVEGSPIYLTLFGPDGSSSSQIGREGALSGHYTMRILVPAGGVSRVEVGIRGTTDLPITVVGNAVVAGRITKATARVAHVPAPALTPLSRASAPAAAPVTPADSPVAMPQTAPVPWGAVIAAVARGRQARGAGGGGRAPRAGAARARPPAPPLGRGERGRRARPPRARRGAARPRPARARRRPREGPAPGARGVGPTGATPDVGSDAPDDAVAREAALVRRAQAGDAEAYGDLVTMHQAAAFRVAHLLAGSAADAEDAAQEAFVKAYLALGRFRAGEPFRPWLLQVVGNEARNRRRARGRRAGLLDRAVAAVRGSAGSGAPSPEAVVVLGELRDEVGAALLRLRDEERTVVACRYLLELSEAETASALGVPAGTVKSRLHRALGRLRDDLGERGPMTEATP